MSVSFATSNKPFDPIEVTTTMSRSNNSISDETLMGYLLMALPDDEQWRIEKLAAEDAELQQRIRDLRELMDPIRESVEEFEPRSDLTASTMSLILDEDLRANTEHAVKRVGLSAPFFENSNETRFAWLDSLVTLVAGVVVLSILLPSIWFSREASRRVSCSANLREIGQALTVFAQSNAEQRIPQIEVDGPLSFAGIYSIRLKDAGLLDSTRWIWCPLSETLDLDQPIPSLEEYLATSPKIQENIRLTAGGNYSYNLGNIVNGVYCTPRLTDKSHFAVMGDTLLFDDSDIDFGPIHGRNAANVLFEDGRVQFIRVDHIDSSVDNPYLNRTMHRGVGLGPNDSCIGPSYLNPLKGVSATW